MAGRRVAEWRFPNDKQQRAEETLRRLQQAAAPPPSPPVDPTDPMTDAYWEAVLADPRARAKPGVPI